MSFEAFYATQTPPGTGTGAADRPKFNPKLKVHARVRGCRFPKNLLHVLETIALFIKVTATG